MISNITTQVINALVELSALPPGESRAVSVIAKKINAPREYLSKVLQGLVREGIVVSQKGLKGGFSLAKAPKDICLYDVFKHLENLESLEGCFMKRSDCSKTNVCAAHQRWKSVRTVYMDFLMNTTIADLKK